MPESWFKRATRPQTETITKSAITPQIILRFPSSLAASSPEAAMYWTKPQMKNKSPIAMITGIIGLLLLFLWFGTDHSATANNYNLLWAFPFNILIVHQLRKQSPKKWIKGFLKFLIIMLVLLIMHWVIGVQVFAIGLIPLLLAIALRYIYVVKTL